jgi:putative tryptophan/tyrosine transport system substrate-binding protein
VAQQSERVRRIGVLMNFAVDDPEAQSRNAGFLQGLSELGWTVGRNLRIDYRWAGGDTNRYRSYAAELLALAPPSSAMNSRRLTASIGLPATGCVFTYSIKPV